MSLVSQRKAREWNANLEFPFIEHVDQVLWYQFAKAYAIPKS